MPLDVETGATTVDVFGVGASVFFKTEVMVVGAFAAGVEATGATATILVFLTAGTTGATVARR